MKSLRYLDPRRDIFDEVGLATVVGGEPERHVPADAEHEHATRGPRDERVADRSVLVEGPLPGVGVDERANRVVAEAAHLGVLLGRTIVMRVGPSKS